MAWEVVPAAPLVVVVTGPLREASKLVECGKPLGHPHETIQINDLDFVRQPSSVP